MMSTVSRTVPALSAIAVAFPGFGQAADGGNFTEKITHRPRGRSCPALALRDVMHQTGRRCNLRERSYRNMIGNADPAAQHHEIPQRHRAGKPAMAGDYAAAADAY